MIFEDKQIDLEEILENISYGSHDALTELYLYTKAMVYGFSLSILKNPHEAEDVLQEVYIKIYESADLYQKNGKPVAWILTITKNLSLMKIRKQKYQTDLEGIEETLTDYKGKNHVEDKLFVETIFKYLTDEERNILVLHAVSGFKHWEIAKMLKIPLATVLSKYHRTIKKIKKRMGEEGYE